MSINQQQLTQAISQIEEQLAILKQAVGDPGIAPEGIVGVFDGEFMVEESGKRHQVPPNYASKTMLVPGDTIRMIEDKDGGQTKYKQIGKAERAKTSGILVKKDGKYEVLAEEGSFKVLSASIKHYNGEVGDQIFIQYPKQHVKGSWAAVEKVVNQSASAPAAVIPDMEPVLAAPIDASPEPQPIQHLAPSAAPSGKPVDAARTLTPKAPANHASKAKSRSPIKPRISGAGKNSDAPNRQHASNGSAEKVENSKLTTPVAPVNNPIPLESFGDDDLI